MSHFIIDANQCTSKQETYDYLIKKLELPDYTGHNLDALWDILSSRSHFTLEIIDAREIIQHLGEYGFQLLNLFGDLVSEEYDRQLILHW